MAFPLAILGFIPNLFTYWQKQQELKLRWWELGVKVGCDLVRFIFAHIRIICICLILALVAIHYLSLRHQYHVANAGKLIAQKALNDYVTANNQAAKKREAENKLNAILAQKKTAASQAQHQAELSIIVAKGKQDEILNHRTISNARSQLRHTIESYEAARLLKNDTSGIAERNSDPALPRPVHEAEAELVICKEAGAIAAADYNLCKGYVDIQQSILGVTK